MCQGFFPDSGPARCQAESSAPIQASLSFRSQGMQLSSFNNKKSRQRKFIEIKPQNIYHFGTCIHHLESTDKDSVSNPIKVPVARASLLVPCPTRKPSSFPFLLFCFFV